MRFFFIHIFIAGACGKVLEAPADSPAPDDAPPTPVKVTVLSYAGDGLPDPAAQMIVQDAQGNVVLNGPVDQEGKLEATIPGAGMVTAVRFITDTPASLRAELTTIMDVMPGDELTFGLKPPPTITSQGGQTTMSASFTPFPGAADHTFYTTCGTTFASTTSPVTLSFRDSCRGPTFDLVVVASGGSLTTPRFISLQDIAYQNGQSFTVPGVYSTMGSFTVSALNVPAEISSLIVTRSSMMENTPVATQTVTLGDPAAGTTTVAVPFATGVGSRSAVVLTFSRAGMTGFQQHSLHTAALGTSVPVDFAQQQLPWLNNLSLNATGVAWTTAVQGKTPEGMLAIWNGQWSEAGRTTTVAWRIASPISAEGLTLPRLPPKYAAVDPAAQTATVIPHSGQVFVVDYDILGGYRDFRQQPDTLITPFIHQIGVFVGMPYQRRMYSASVP